MSNDLKDKAAQAYGKGKFAKAAELYQAYCAAEPRDHQSRVRLGDAWTRAGKVPQAVAAYRLAAEGFAREGFLPRAIAAAKLILEIDPAHAEVQQMIASLYARKRGPARPASMPAGAEVVAETSVSPQRAIDLEPAGGPSSRAIELEPPSAPPRSEAESTIALGLGEIELDPLPPSAALTPPAARSVGVPAEVPPSARREASIALGGGEIELDTGGEDSGSDIELDTETGGTAEAGSDIVFDSEPEAPPPARAPVTTPRPARASGPQRPTEVVKLADVADLAPPAPPRPKTPPPPNAEISFDEPLRPASSGPTKFDELELDMESASAALWSGPEKKPVEAPSSGSLLEAVERAAELGAQGPWLEPLDVEPGEPSNPARRGLPDVPLFSDLDRDAFLALFHRCPLLRRNPGDSIVRQGALGDAFYVVCSGSVRVLREENGHSRAVAEIGEGGFFGEMSLLSGSPRAASVEAASEDTQLLELSAPVLAEVAKSFPGVARALKRFGRQRMLANVIETSALFNVFDRKERKALAERFLVSEAPAGETLIQEGGESDGLYVILSGEVEVRKGGVPVALLREGEVFGEMSLLTKSAAEASVTARRKTTVLRLPRPDFDALILSHPQVLVLVSELTDARRNQLHQI